ncbi:MAG: molybdopterin cofactor-binding domain-containing protein, partial [Chloroflexota bacterium]
MTEVTTQDGTRPPQRRMSRRKFLRNLGIGTGVLMVGIAVNWPTIRREGQLAINQAFLASGEGLGAEMPASPFTWIRIDPDNTVHLYLPKIEMGQGIHTTLAQIAAEDLELDWGQIQTHTAETDRGFADFTSFTFGSSSTKSLYTPIREIAATLRVMLLTEGATQLSVAMSDIEARNGRIMLKDDPNIGLSYGEIVTYRQDEWVLPDDIVPLKSNSDFNFIGQSMPRVDLYEKVTGRAVYGFDARAEDTLHGAVARPPRYGARLMQAAAGDALTQPGVVQVMIRDNFAGVIAQTRAQAYAALDHLNLIWDGGTNWSQEDVDAFMAIPDNEGVLVQRVGNRLNSLGDAATFIQAEYNIPLASHAHRQSVHLLMLIVAPGVRG